MGFLKKNIYTDFNMLQKSNGILPSWSEIESDAINARRLAEGMVDLWVSGVLTGRYHAKQSDIDDIKVVYEGEIIDLYIAMNKAVPDELIDQLNTELQKMKKEGVVDKILKKYR